MSTLPQSKLQFYEFESDKPADCGAVLDIELASHSLDWPGVILEKGSSPYFYPSNVYTPYFYFALAVEQDLHWQAKTDKGMATLTTSPGDIWINPPDTPFSHEISEPCYFVILAIEKVTFLHHCPISLPAEGLGFLNNYNVDDDTLRGIIDLFLVEVTTGGRNGYSYIKHLISLISLHYINNYSNYLDLQNQQITPSKFDQAALDKIDRYIEDNINQVIAIDSLADLVFCSKYHFLREFKKVMGVTPYQHLLAKRLERAQYLLEQPGNQIINIVAQLGFNDQPHFSRAFKKRYGITPGQFQKSQS